MLRAFLLTENTLIRDGDFSLERVLGRANEFSDIYGNLVTRSLSKNIAGPVVTIRYSNPLNWVRIVVWIVLLKRLQRSMMPALSRKDLN